MTTCRLLCVLLVLSLCCCPSVCVTADGVDEQLAPNAPKATGAQLPVKEEVEQSKTVEKTVIATGTEKAQGTVSGGLSNNQVASVVSGQSQLQGPDVPLQPPTATTVTSGAKSGPIQSEKEQEKETTATTTTTTTTTKALTTTTTTTTTTAAPEAPSTKTTTTTTTTRAPSRLREVDGSLSSPAWVCAPLLLAASTLACTALG
ncbi:mucin TcMUCII [Trypanosoma cruzi cruzi]|uniref:Putative mucin TcMUCII n=1 Tax=Trypanosoma cruzi TaxID=5693 RepID=A0A2V2VRH8_TRYCR|nr:mucin TcMUCII [Trypanosoma cruzi cruzi]PWU98754.1 putative mucin TcMUCII [Trypanosoma cruzi]